MFRTFTFPMTAERSWNKERLEMSLARLCELDLLKQRQEFLVLGALSIGNPVPGRPAWSDPQSPRPSPDTADCARDDLSYRRNPGSLQCTPWGLMATLELQVGELKVDKEANMVELPGDAEDSRPSSGFYELGEFLSPMGLSDSSGFGELSPNASRDFRMTYANDRPKPAGEVFVSNRDGPPDSASHTTPPRSFLAPYPSLDGIAEGASEEKTWPWDPRARTGNGQEVRSEVPDGEPTEEDYRQAQRVETYILGLIQRRALPPRPCKPRTSLGPHESRTAITVVRQSSLCRKEPPPATASLPEHQPHHYHASGPSPSEGPCPSWACRSLEQEPYVGMALLPEDPPLHHHQHPTPHYPQPRLRQPPLANMRSASLDHPCGGAPCQDPSSSEPDSPRRFNHSNQAPPPPRSPPSPDEQLVNAQYIPAQPLRIPTARASGHSHSHRTGPVGPQPGRDTYSPDRGSQGHTSSQQLQSAKTRTASKKSQSENSLNGQRGVTERKYSTVDRDGGGSGSGSGRGSQSKGKKPQPGNAGCRRWRSTLELSQDEAEQPPQPPPAQQGPRRTRRSRPAHQSYVYGNPHHHFHHPHLDHLERERTPMCRPEDSYPHPGHGESESSLSEADSPASSSLSSDSDESGGLVWPQQLPPQLSSPPAPAGAPLQPKAFVKIKAS
ncbi:hypothetical protein UPYG_G00124270 [Umbra pygmaea]|uniref:Uncharacterized protein n=1 Tax=Umbra pygmaea TaxID=75934 RepID=A0ABD0X9L6_UMBPY